MHQKHLSFRLNKPSAIPHRQCTQNKREGRKRNIAEGKKTPPELIPRLAGSHKPPGPSLCIPVAHPGPVDAAAPVRQPTPPPSARPCSRIKSLSLKRTRGWGKKMMKESLVKYVYVRYGA